MPKITEARRPPTLYMGIDPGASGGIAIVGNKYLQVHKMPEGETAIWELISKYGWSYDDEPGRLGMDPQYRIYAAIEQVGGFAKGRKLPGNHMFNFGMNYGWLCMALTAANIPYLKIHPNVWQRAMGIEKHGKEESDNKFKNRIKVLAQALFPNTKVTLNTADALVLAEYCRRDKEGRL